MKKKMFTIVETKTVTETIYYEVEADSKEQAMEKVQYGDWKYNCFTIYSSVLR